MVSKRMQTGIFVGLLVTLVCSRAFGQTAEIPTPTPTQGEKDPGAVIVPINKGKIVPFSGTLLSPQSVAIITAELSTAKRRCAVEVDTAVARCEATATRNVEQCRVTAETDAAIATSREEMLRKTQKVDAARIEQLEEAASSQTSPFTWLGIGTAAGAVLTTAIVMLVHSL